MHVVIFEVKPLPGRAERYFELAAALREELERIDGFISVERFRSLADPDKYLSISFWRDEEAVRRWRGHAQHRAAQETGKAEIFEDFRIRVAEVVRDYGMEDRRSR